MRKNFAPLLAIAFVVAILCTAVFYSLVSSKFAADVKAKAPGKVVVAAHEIPRGKTLAKEDLKAVPWAGSEVPTGTFANEGQAIGLVAVQTIGREEPVTNLRAMSPTTGGGLGIPTGMRAISVSVNESGGVLAMLKTGHRVDVQAIYVRSSAADSDLRTVLQNVEVLKIGGSPESGGNRNMHSIVTLLVTPAEADVIGLADAVAKIRLVLRNPLDSERAHRSVVAMGPILRSATHSPTAARATASKPPQPKTVALVMPGAACTQPAATIPEK